jgi:hypothetical protein
LPARKSEERSQQERSIEKKINTWNPYQKGTRRPTALYTHAFESGKEKKKKKKNGESCSVFIHISSSRTHARKPAERIKHHTQKKTSFRKKERQWGIVPDARER